MSQALLVTQSYVLDASALLAWLQGEPGGEVVEPLLNQSVMSSINWAEVLQKSISRGVQREGMQADLEAIGLQILPFTALDAERVAQLYLPTQPQGLSLGDRACLALAESLNLPALTTDRVWGDLNLGIEIQVLR
ncbi:MAG: type II toxin-antitoxin system VapC family toxin [Kastovskya adunca ATA6-11-RM4]|jgi:PIN domain nuclease of toxin-antitoxin system|nr:type II toxin-antitoxin system VapC family toxin [Kastovskya adunca ATA6-11-RM4]